MSGGEYDIVRPHRHLDVDQLVALFDFDRFDAVHAHVGVLRKRRLLDRAVLGSEEQKLVVRKVANGDDRRDVRIRRHVDHVDDRLALRGAPCLRNLVHLEPEAAAVVGKDEDVVVRRGDEQMLHEILVLQRRPVVSAAAPALLLVRRHRRPLDVSRV